MPELPEVETIRKGIMPHVQNHKVQEVVIRQSKLRWPVSPELREEMTGQYITSFLAPPGVPCSCTWACLEA